MKKSFFIAISITLHKYIMLRIKAELYLISDLSYTFDFKQLLCSAEAWNDNGEIQKNVSTTGHYSLCVNS